MKRFIALFLTIFIGLSIHSPHQASAEAAVSNWWPVQGATLSGATPLKGAVNGYGVNEYDMYWSVDNGIQNYMPTNYGDYPHKEVSIDVRAWTWHGAGPYNIAFIAKNKSGNEIGRTSFAIYNKDAPATVATLNAVSKPLVGNILYIDPNSDSARQAAAWRINRPTDAAQIDKIATSAQAKWLGGWNTDVASDTAAYVTAANRASQVPTLVTYNIPQRDCGSYSAGGLSADRYISWIQSVANGIGTQKAIIVVEPDALAGMDCLNSGDQATRSRLLADAVAIFKRDPQARVYLDAGNAHWQTPATMASRLANAGIAGADGFSLNVSNFISTSESTDYGQRISSSTGGKHFVIDTSRNGSGTGDTWCNPWGRSLGAKPTTSVNNDVVDAYLWIKTPGQSDGACNGGGPAGSWWPDYALGLAQRASY